MANTKKNQYLRRSKPKKIIGCPKKIIGGVPPPTESFDQLITAIKKNNIDLIRTLINNHNVNLHNNGTTPLHHASSIGNTEVVQLLIDNGANINAKNNFGSTPLHYAST